MQRVRRIDGPMEMPDSHDRIYVVATEEFKTKYKALAEFVRFPSISACFYLIEESNRPVGRFVPNMVSLTELVGDAALTQFHPFRRRVHSDNDLAGESDGFEDVVGPVEGENWDCHEEPEGADEGGPPVTELAALLELYDGAAPISSSPGSAPAASSAPVPISPPLPPPPPPPCRHDPCAGREWAARRSHFRSSSAWGQCRVLCLKR